MLALDTRRPKKTAEQERTEDEVREWFAILCDCVRNRDRTGLRIAARELEERGVGVPIGDLDDDLKRESRR